MRSPVWMMKSGPALFAAVITFAQVCMLLLESPRATKVISELRLAGPVEKV
jgi:hypothetical protein